MTIYWPGPVAVCAFAAVWTLVPATTSLPRPVVFPLAAAAALAVAVAWVASPLPDTNRPRRRTDA